jgi:hypothetical protein
MIEQAKTINSTHKMMPQPQPVQEQPRPKPKVSCSQSNSHVSIINFKNPPKQPEFPFTTFSFDGILFSNCSGYCVEKPNYLSTVGAQYLHLRSIPGKVVHQAISFFWASRLMWGRAKAMIAGIPRFCQIE